MSNIYKTINPDTGEEQFLVSKEYVDLRIKAIKDVLYSINKQLQMQLSADNTVNHNSNDNLISLFDTENIVPLTVKAEAVEVNIEDVKLDSQHKFVSQAQIEAFKAKPSLYEVESLINKSADEFKNYVQQLFIDMLNMPDAVSKLHAIADLVDDEVNLNKLIEAVRLRVSEEELRNHANSKLHITKNDRAILNVLANLVADGSIDKLLNSNHTNTSDMSYNSMRLDGRSLDEIKRHSPYGLIIGVAGAGETKAYEVDVLLPGGCELGSRIHDLALYNIPGKVLFKPGRYIMNPGFDINKSDAFYDTLIIEGCGAAYNCTQWELLDSIRMGFSGITMRDIAILGDNNRQCEFVIGSGLKLSGIRFEKVKILFNDNCKFISIKDCTFLDCEFEFTYKGVFTNNIIKDCTFIGCREPRYFGGDNIIEDNIVVR